MKAPLRWTKHLGDAISDYTEGTKMNKSNHNINVNGKPGTGKNQLLSTLKEVGMARDDIKLIETHASSSEHLEEILQFTIPLDFFKKNDAISHLKETRDKIRRDPEDGGYEETEITVSEIEKVFPKKTQEEWVVNYLEQLISREENQTVLTNLRTARSLFKDAKKNRDRIENRVTQNDNMVSEFQDAYKVGSLKKSFDPCVLVPISSGQKVGDSWIGMPSDIDVPDFIEPFGIPVEDYAKYPKLKYGLRQIFEQNVKNYVDMYKGVVDVGDTSLADLKYAKPTEARNYVREINLGGEVVETYKPSDEKQSRRGFGRYWDHMFGQEGVACSSEFDEGLIPKLKEKLLDDETDFIVLYTGFIRDEGLRVFVETYFIETIRSIIANGLSREETKNLDRKFWLSILEAQERLPKNRRGKNIAHEKKVYKQMMEEVYDNSRHLNMDIITDGKPKSIDPMVISKSQHNFLTQIEKKDFDKLYSSLDSDWRERIKEGALNDEDYTNLKGSKSLGYGFIYLNAPSKKTGVPKWGGTYGCRLPAPRMCSQQEVTLSNTNWKVFTQELGFKESGNTIRLKEFQDKLRNDIMDSESEYVEKEDEERRKKIEQREKEETKEREKKKAFAEKTLETKVRQTGLPNKDDPEAPSTWSVYIREISDEIESTFGEEIGERAVEEYVQDKKTELIQELQKEKEEAIDKDRVVRAMCLDRNGNEDANIESWSKDFIMDSISKNDMRETVAQYLEYEEDMRLQPQSNVVKSISRRSRKMLRKAGILNTQNNVDLDFDLDGSLNPMEKQWAKMEKIWNVLDQFFDD